ncbi:ATP phosphoribosyltransferase regulatory subunit [Immundisolibacter sp.]|uniref:ATP phosphoribosyltransferase regulatory subunit n=1 Tax=Immundisolibacter sp. TaxID=1934948 RepID=UPI002608A407|nr:ATP phosphoribosyltransferase regulatory subunit [Immundisolibacter sp.]MDD3650313.1 ATP phosphoribosyltransferase regulatory subunit [Immundisolibacter sp.]
MRWLLPPGIEDLLPPQAQALESARRRLLDLFAAWGYRLVMPPLVEYADALLTGTGADLAEQTFQVTDPLSGRLLAIRADITPQVARIDARDGNPAPARLCYLGSVLTAQEGAPGTCRNPMQVGAELYGHGGPESDVEVLRLLLETLRATGHDKVHVDLGHVGIFRGLSEAAGLDSEAEHALFELLQRKARPDIAAFVTALGLPAAARDWFVQLPQCFGPIDRLPELRARLRDLPASVTAAIDALETIAHELLRFVPDLPLFVDLAELRGYHYHTGLVFAAYGAGFGQAMAWGGRYDGVGGVFGRARPATGFSADLKRLLGTPPAPPLPVLAPWSSDPELTALIERLRADGRAVIHELPGSEPGPVGARIVRHDGAWRLQDAG